MNDYQLKIHLQELVRELERRQKPKDQLDEIIEHQMAVLTPATDILDDLRAARDAIDNYQLSQR